MERWRSGTRLSSRESLLRRLIGTPPLGARAYPWPKQAAPHIPHPRVMDFRDFHWSPSVPRMARKATRGYL
jgi:hypothetical protein